MTAPVSGPADVPSRPPFRRTLVARPPYGPIGLFLLVLLLLAAGTGWYLFTRPRLVFTNQLAAPIRIAGGEDTPLTLAPGETIRKTMSGSRAFVAQWELIRPLSADGRPMGSEVRGSVVVRAPSGTVRRSASARGSDADYFAPLITNAGADLLRIVVNAGLEGSLDCGCAVRPGAHRVFIGYYPLFQNSTVRARTPDGRAATFRNLGPNVTAADGSVGLRFESADLR
ncbi:MAG: hypothetical protein ACJ8BF_00715 [Gemmatimonadales bacterium]